GALARDATSPPCAAHPAHPSPNEPVSHHHDVATGASHSGHHHEAAAGRTGTANTAAMIPVPHACDHVDAVLTASREVVRAPVPNDASAAVDIAPVLLRALPPTDIDSRHGPPARLQSTSP